MLIKKVPKLFEALFDLKTSLICELFLNIAILISSKLLRFSHYFRRILHAQSSHELMHSSPSPLLALVILSVQNITAFVTHNEDSLCTRQALNMNIMF